MDEDESVVVAELPVVDAVSLLVPVVVAAAEESSVDVEAESSVAVVEESSVRVGRVVSAASTVASNRADTARIPGLCCARRHERLGRIMRSKKRY